MLVVSQSCFCHIHATVDTKRFTISLCIGNRRILDGIYSVQWRPYSVGLTIILQGITSIVVIRNHILPFEIGWKLTLGCCIVTQVIFLCQTVVYAFQCRILFASKSAFANILTLGEFIQFCLLGLKSFKTKKPVNPLYRGFLKEVLYILRISPRLSLKEVIPQSFPHPFKHIGGSLKSKKNWAYFLKSLSTLCVCITKHSWHLKVLNVFE